MSSASDNIENTPPPGSSRQALGKSVAKAKRALPKSSPLKVKVISRLVCNLSPHSKKTVFSSARKSLNGMGRPLKISLDLKDSIVKFLEQPDISYTCPGRKDTVYCGKCSQTGEKIYKTKHYLLNTIKEIVAVYNAEHESKTTYYQVREVIANEKHLVLQAKTPEDDCRCEICENAQLLLDAIKTHFRKTKENDLVKDLPLDPLELVEVGVCSCKNYECMTNKCQQCPGKAPIASVCEALEKVEKIQYYKWSTIEKKVVKRMEEETGEQIAVMLEEVVTGAKMRRHKYNIYRQFSELKFLKRNLKKEEVILSVDFSKNYDNKQRHEIQSAYFGHDNFTIFTAACYMHNEITVENFSKEIDEETNLTVVPIAIVSNETSHDRNVAFTNNNKLIKIVKEINPNISTFHFWSDGCAGQFRSRYVFRSFSFYPDNIKLTWNYGEAHHFKGNNVWQFCTSLYCF